MKKYLKFPVYVFCLALASLMFSACSDNDDPIPEVDEKEKALLPIVENYVDNIIIVTYKNLADAAIDLNSKLKALKAEKTDANVKAAADAWKTSREHWELSEAFLFGPVDDYGIDPHIDTWPLDVEGFNRLMKSKDILEKLNKEDSDLDAINNVHESLLGFHGIEYILFAEGTTKSASKISDDELIYAVAVGNDLRDRCIELEACWAGKDKVTEAKKKLIEARELRSGRENTDYTFRDMMLHQKGNVYPTITSAAGAILQYAFVIADEVGNTKIGTAANESANEENRNYIESPYSYNSLKDFKDNIVGVENAYLGKAYGKEGASISAYILSIDPDADKAIKEAIAASYKAIDAIPAPFVKNFTSPEADKAVEVIGTTLADALINAKLVLLKD